MRRVLPILLPTCSALVLFLALEAAKRLGWLPVFVPGPSEVLVQAWNQPALLLGNLWPTAVTATTGYVIALAAALLAACIAAVLPPLRGPIYSFGVTLNAIPIIATAPLLALWLGTGQRTQIVIAALATQFPMLVGAMQGLNAADGKQREMLHALSASPWQTFWYLSLPSALPYLFAGLKVAAPLAVLGATTAEWAGADRGVGAMMLYALFSYDVVKVWIAVIMCCLMASTAYALGALAERYVVTWQRDPEADR